jgi:hypothetical protein
VSNYKKHKERRKPDRSERTLCPECGQPIFPPRLSQHRFTKHKVAIAYLEKQR